jgi:thiol-disulfide isomerase/thioredoxin
MSSASRRRCAVECAASLVRTLAVTGLLALAACGRGERAEPEPGLYRATLSLPGGELPFGVEIAREGGRTVLFLVNGAERLRVDAVTVTDGTLKARMPGFENTLTARIEGDTLRGDVVLVKREGREQVIPFAARRGADYRFFPTASAAGADVAGRWAMTFTEPDGTESPAVGEFQQRGNSVVGTFLTPTGDHRYLAGEVRGDELFLSTFDGAHAYLYRASLTADGSLRGTFWSGLAWQQAFTGRRDDTANLDGAPATAMRADAERFNFTFPDPEGRPVSLTDPRFADKVVVVTLAGSWCPNCRDEASFLAPWYLENRARGVEVIALMFEHFGDFERAAGAVALLRQDLGIEYTTLIAGISDKQAAARQLPQLNGIYAFPTTLFVDRAGRVRFIHTGYAGPGTGEHHVALVAKFNAVVDGLLAERS